MLNGRDNVGLTGLRNSLEPKQRQNTNDEREMQSVVATKGGGFLPE